MMDQKITLFRFAEKFLSRTISLLFYLEVNCGASAARNYGLRNVRGKYVVSVDSDDSITDDYVSALTQNQRPIILILSS